MEFPGDRPLLRIGELSRRLGVSDHVLRAWESRYGLLQPVRSPGGFRLYSGADELRIRRMQAYLAEGLSAAEAARAAVGREASTSRGYLAGPRLTESAGSEPFAGLRQALDAFDEPAAQAVQRLRFAMRQEQVSSGRLSRADPSHQRRAVGVA